MVDLGLSATDDLLALSIAVREVWRMVHQGLEEAVDTATIVTEESVAEDG
ncbi:MAG: hypothetical protein AMXMBFR46_28730 [Acidimicrobiia bacterium]